MLTDVLNAAGVTPDRHATALVALDKLDKVGLADVKGELADRGVSAESIRAISGLHESAKVFGENAPKGAESSLTMLRGLGETYDTMSSVVTGDAGENLRLVFEAIGQTSAASRVVYDPFLARGLSYYTGAIMEINVADLAGSLGGGGRYDDLVGMFLGQPVPACGFSLGLERILVVMAERDMFPAPLHGSAADVMVSVFEAAGSPHALRLAGLLRAAGLRVIVYPDADKIGKQIKYADSLGIPRVALLGSDEIAAGTVTVRTLAARTQEIHPQEAAAAAILEALRRRG
jgi:histidyl-tRNA synthetase